MTTTVQAIIKTNGAILIAINAPVSQEEFLRQAKEIITMYGRK